MNKKIVNGIVIGSILLITIVVLMFLIVYKKNEQIKDKQSSEAFKKLMDDRATRKKGTPPQGFLSPNSSDISDCILQTSYFEEESVAYRYNCQIDKTFPPNLIYEEEAGKNIDEAVEIEKNSKAPHPEKFRESRTFDEFIYLDSKVVVVGFILTTSDGKISRPLRYSLYWMHENNLVTITTIDPEVVSKDKLIEVLKSLSLT